MNSKVQNFIEKIQQEELDREKSCQYAHLIELGLYDVEYGPDNCFSEEFPDMEDGRYCKKKPIEVTQEEYESICQVAPVTPPKNWPVWPVDKILFVLSMIMYSVGFIGGIASGTRVSGYNQSGEVYHTFLWTHALTYWLVASFFGSILLGFSEHLRLLKKISKD
ncbi:hypothetical protein OBV_03410 [Oscillibacter valericigenes Sjm18-20]|nr:hypothetical protein OBV_03410 [Oscillibacter valericigenes Sjm18-20]